MDMQTHHLLMEGGLQPSRKRLSYASPEFQDLLRSAFGDLLPRIKWDEDERYWHEHFDEESRETTSLSRALAPGEAWPAHEVRRLLEGWKRLRDSAARIQDPRLQAMAYGLQFPDPGADGRCYRVYRDVHGLIRMHVLFGFAPNDARRAFLAETLFESLTVRQTIKTPQAVPVQAPPRQEKNNPWLPRGIARQVIPAYLSLACVLSLSAVFIAIFVTTIPELVRRQANLGEEGAKAQLIPAPIPKGKISG